MKKIIRLTERDLTRIVKRVINEEAESVQCGTGNIPPLEGDIIELVYNDHQDYLLINGKEEFPWTLNKNKKTTNKTELEDGSYEAWGGVDGAAIVKDGEFTGYCINPGDSAGYAFPVQTRCGQRMDAVPIFIEQDVWFIDSEYPSKRTELSTEKERQTFYEY